MERKSIVQAVLILAHKNLDQVIELCNTLNSFFNVYVHVDNKCQITTEQRRKLKDVSSYYSNKYNVKWGSYSIVRATIMLMNEALKNEDNQYFHLISGQDWPLRSPQEIFDYYENNNSIYMNYFKSIDIVKSGEKLIWWTRFYFNYDYVNRRSLFGKIYHRFLIRGQRILKINKLKRFGIQDNYMYSGEEWIDIPRDALEYALSEYERRKELQKIFSSSFCSDEMWIQTILCNSKFKQRIEKNTHRYINWERKNGSYPAILDDKDYEEIMKGQYFWGRKFETPYSDKLKKMLAKTNK